MPHTDVNQETDCGLMVVFHIYMQELRQQDSKVFSSQSRTGVNSLWLVTQYKRDMQAYSWLPRKEGTAVQENSNEMGTLFSAVLNTN